MYHFQWPYFVLVIENDTSNIAFSVRKVNIYEFKSFPKVETGADIFILERPERKKLSVQEVLGITSSLATIALIIDRLSN